MSDNFSGMAVKIDKHSFILINSNHSIGRQNFTIGHELYHLFIQEDFETHFCKAGNFNKSDIQEYYADLFSSALLMPDDGILEKIPTAEQNKNKISLATVLELENYFGCSRTALLYKLKMMKKIDADKYDEFRKDIKSTARLNGYDIALYSKGREGIIISDYGTKA
ncbi:MAG TPA: ImmA/IrrE family metallo-endopeptidase, partial [Ignavibacteriales bacterium]|nr:ImmA/IrrE family metallo-endopeptidase [Ignavibacteriales bacterium]